MSGRLFSAVLLLTISATLAFAADPKVTKEAPIVPPHEGKSETIELFNGKDLDNWLGHKELWSVDGGEIVGHNPKENPVSTYLLTKDNYTDFRLLVTAKLAKTETHSGVAFWGRLAPEQKDEFTYAGHLVMFPKGYGVYDLYGRKSLPVDPAPAKKVGMGRDHEWNDVEILAQGNRIRVALNGTAVVDWRDPEVDSIKAGPIGLQLHSNKDGQEVRFKNLKLTTFPADDKLITVK